MKPGEKVLIPPHLTRGKKLSRLDLEALPDDKRRLLEDHLEAIAALLSG